MISSFRSRVGDDAVRDFKIEVDHRCPCPNINSLLRGKTLGSTNAEIFLLGNYKMGVLSMNQGSLAVIANEVNKKRMRGTQQSNTLCPYLLTKRQGQRS